MHWKELIRVLGYYPVFILLIIVFHFLTQQFFYVKKIKKLIKLAVYLKSFSNIHRIIILLELDSCPKRPRGLKRKLEFS